MATSIPDIHRFLAPVANTGSRPSVMHINFFFGVRDNPDGSSEKVQVSFARAFKRWHPILAGRGNSTERYVYRGLDCYSFAEDRIKNRVLNKWLNLKAFTFSRVIPLIEHTRPDILHFHYRHEFIDRIVGRLRYRPKVVVHYHRQFVKLVVPESADLLVAVSEHIRDHVRTKSATRKPIEVVYNPLPEDLLAHVPQTRVPRAKPVLLYAGGYFTHKGFFDLEKAVESLPRDTFELRLCGHDFADYRPTRSEVKVVGFLASDQFIEAIIDSDVVLMPSHHEPFGLVALEAMYCRRLVVASRGAGLESFCDSRNAILVEPRNPDSLADGIRQAIEICRERSDVYVDKTQRAFETSQRFSAARLAGELETLYDRVQVSCARIDPV